MTVLQVNEDFVQTVVTVAKKRGVAVPKQVLVVEGYLFWPDEVSLVSSIQEDRPDLVKVAWTVRTHREFTLFEALPKLLAIDGLDEQFVFYRQHSRFLEGVGRDPQWLRVRLHQRKSIFTIFHRYVDETLGDGEYWEEPPEQEL